MPEYRALRERHAMLEVIRTPELAAQVTLMPVDAFGVDAAIVFSDILPPLVGMGLDLDFVKGDGPRIGNPISSLRDVDLLGTPPAEETMSGTLGAIALVRRELETRGIPVIGFAGAPFTLASYAIEGGTSKDFSKTKAFMLSEPAAWRRLLTKLATVQADYLLAQARAGAQALQVFDSWAGRALGREDYLRYVAPVNRDLYAVVAGADVPVINFSLGVSAYLADAAACGGDVVGLDWQLPLDEAWALLGPDRPVQGNLDPASLLAPWRELRVRIDDVLERAAGRPGHVFNVGHGVVPQTPVDNVRRLVEHVRERDVAMTTARIGHGVRRAGVARGDSRLSRGHPRRAPDPARGCSTRSRRTTAPSAHARRCYEVTRRQVDALQEELGDAFRCYLGMRHWTPWIEDVVGQMIEDGVTRAIGIVLAPQFSALSVAKYQQRVADGLDLYRGRIEFEHVPSYHDASGLIEAFASRVAEGLSRWPEDERDHVRVVFTAHSLPERVLANGDPYGAQCLETARLVAERAGISHERWSWSYQSAGRTPEPWAGPDLGEHLRELSARGVRDVVVVPIGFVSDHVEILFDIDVRARAVAEGARRCGSSALPR